MSNSSHSQALRTQRSSHERTSSQSSGLNPEAELDPRVSTLSHVALYTDIPDATLQSIMNIAVDAYNKFVLVPTRNTWRKEEGSRKELEREVERTALRDIAQAIKLNVESALGGTWHVVYGRSFATYVTHQRQCFCHFQLDGANVVVWRHGG
ncbi:putative Dynein light chain type 1 [Trypanosoma vivax]|uniref:Dynein light chain n=1 Tax=Trypanosoma vivax (strain Y486) TaxID=1055687 RepID=G0U3C2_TRYVY|nr:hypothetical protein TRVL_03505 [Trypanosoma vivax]KAH8604176.1 putative Dynein light chain type 1 [Trypanosoma vivax]CCC50778.1 conserved hypothetical protein [Trypanosoma vivax Y486]